MNQPYDESYITQKNDCKLKVFIVCGQSLLSISK
jgi:hypothetical protein